MRIAGLLSALLVILLTALPLDAQDRRRGGGGRGQSDRPMSEEEIRERVGRAEGFLRKLDTNGNGVIDPEEVSGPQRQFIDRIFSRGGIEPKFPIAISQIQQSMANSYRAQSPGGSGHATGGGFSSRPGGAPGGPPSAQGMSPPVTGGPPGFGMTPGFGVSPAGVRPSVPGVAVPTAAGAGAVGLDPAIDQKIRTLAATTIRTNDKDGDGKLIREEWATVSRLGTFDEANRMAGTFVVMDELVIHLSDYFRRGQLPSDLLDSGDSSHAPDAVSAAAPKKRSNRFLTPAERLPKGLPDWFLSKDADADGQITMVEFAREWTSQRAAEFDRYDLNHDGMITADECLKYEKQSTR